MILSRVRAVLFFSLFCASLKIRGTNLVDMFLYPTLSTLPSLGCSDATTVTIAFDKLTRTVWILSSLALVAGYVFDCPLTILNFLGQSNTWVLLRASPPNYFHSISFTCHKKRIITRCGTSNVKNCWYFLFTYSNTKMADVSVRAVCMAIPSPFSRHRFPGGLPCSRHHVSQKSNIPVYICMPLVVSNVMTC